MERKKKSRNHCKEIREKNKKNRQIDGQKVKQIGRWVDGK